MTYRTSDFRNDLAERYKQLAARNLALDMLAPYIDQLPQEATFRSLYDFGVSRPWTRAPGDPEWNVQITITMDYDDMVRRLQDDVYTAARILRDGGHYERATALDKEPVTVNDLSWRARVRPIGATFRALKARPHRDWEGNARTVDDDGEVRYLFQSPLGGSMFRVTGVIVVPSGGIAPGCKIEQVTEWVTEPARTYERTRTIVTCPDSAQAPAQLAEVGA
jgi:hypothetical protein